MSLVTTTLRPQRTISVSLQFGSQIVTEVMPDRLAVLIGARQVVVGPAGVAGATRTFAIVSAAEVTPNADAYDMVAITAQDGPLLLANPSPVLNITQGQRLMIRIEDVGASQPITYGSQYRGLAMALPAATVAGKTMYLGFIWNAIDVKWDLLAYATQL